MPVQRTPPTLSRKTSDTQSQNNDQIDQEQGYNLPPESMDDSYNEQIDLPGEPTSIVADGPEPLRSRLRSQAKGTSLLQPKTHSIPRAKLGPKSGSKSGPKKDQSRALFPKVNELEGKVDTLSSQFEQFMKRMDSIAKKLEELPLRDSLNGSQATSFRGSDIESVASSKRSSVKSLASKASTRHSVSQDNLKTTSINVINVTPKSPPEFTGELLEAAEWLCDFDDTAKVNHWTDNDKVKNVRRSLTKAGKSWYVATWPTRGPATWTEFLYHFDKTFQVKGVNDYMKSKLKRNRQAKTQDLMEYYLTSMELCAKVNVAMPEAERINHVIDGIYESDARSSIRMTNPRTLIQLQEAILNWNADHRNTKPELKEKSYSTKSNIDRGNGRPQIDTKEMWCLNCGRKGHPTRDCKQPLDQERMRKRKEEWNSNPPYRRPAPSNNNARALVSNEIDNMAEEDLEELEELLDIIISEDIEPKASSVRLMRSSSKELLEVKPHEFRSNRVCEVKCVINGSVENAILDTGATLTVVPISLIRKTNIPMYGWSGQGLSLADGSPERPLGFAILDVEYENRTTRVQAVILKHAPDILLGENFIQAANLVISYAEKIVTYIDKYKQLQAKRLQVEAATQTEQDKAVRSIQLQEANNKEEVFYVENYETEVKLRRVTTDCATQDDVLERVVRPKRQITLPPQTRARIEVKTSGESDGFPFVIEPTQFPNLLVIPGVSRRSSHVIDVINISKHIVTLSKRDVIARAISLDAEDTRINHGPDLTADQEKKLDHLLDEYHDLFVTSNEEIGIVPFIQHHIDTGNSQPIRSKPFRVSIVEQQKIQHLIDEMLEANVIRKSTSPWASPIVLVKKKGTDDLRFCVDYRKLNKVTVVDPFPIPNMDAVLETLSGNKWFSKLDIKSMYWQVLMDQESQPKTAFVVHCGHYEFNVMPFGLVAAPMTAMRVMSEVIRGIESSTFVFYDDILVFTPTFEQHLNALRKLFERLKQANIKLNKKKCELLYHSIAYLGHIITSEGILPDPIKIKSIEGFATPTNITEARSFIGMCNFFRRYIKGFATIARPIHDTISVKKPFIWTTEAQQAMEKLKAKLTSPPILVHYDPEGDPTIRCDASGYGLGAVLMQKSKDPTKTGVVAYTSRTLTPAERNYATTHKECLAVVHAVKHWRHYLYGKYFEVVTDHHALCWLINTKDHNGQLMRWALILQEYNYKIKYESGKLHSDADSLSRCPLPTDLKDEEQSELPTWPVQAKSARGGTAYRIANSTANGIQPTFDVPSEQREDETYNHIIKLLENPNAKKKLKQKCALYFLRDSKLYRRSKQDHNKYLLALPKSMINYVLRQAHDVPTGGHFGAKKTLETIKSRFYWPTLEKDVINYVKTCDKCQRKKANNQPKQGMMIPMVIPKTPFEIVGVDLMGPLPLSSSHNTHILVITDYLTKFVIACPLRDTSTKRIIQLLTANLFLKHGTPKIMITDNGSNLTSTEMRKFLRLLKIEQKTTSPYRPQTNGQTERYNRVLGNQLAIFAGEKPTTWCRYLDALVFAYNTTIHSSHLQTPFRLVHGREAQTPLDIVIGKGFATDKDSETISQEEILREARKVARKAIQKAQLDAKKRYDEHRVESSFKEGDLILYRQPLIKTRSQKKFKFPWAGPYRIIKVISDVNYQVVHMDNPLDERIVHAAQVKPYHQREMESGNSNLNNARTG